jgi:hypothetical protein
VNIENLSDRSQFFAETSGKTRFGQVFLFQGKAGPSIGRLGIGEESERKRKRRVTGVSTPESCDNDEEERLRDWNRASGEEAHNQFIR